MTIGIYIIIILALGYVSVYIRERYLNVKWMKPLTWLGILIHESAHAIACYATGGKVVRMNVSSTQGSVEHYQPKIPFLGPVLVSVAPLLGGIVIVGILNKVLLANAIEIQSINIRENLVGIFSSFNFLSWQTWVLIVFFLNIGVIVGPSVQDLKNIWLPVVLSFFLNIEEIAQILAFAIALIIINILLFALIWTVKTFITHR
ncbi:M50 family metallopeptidase [Patescibacteria group bacterium]|nr:M50 family metallopeptidase [Patescibacteria group bacterium]